MTEGFLVDASSIEAYAQATRRPVKPLVRARLRMAVNKSHKSPSWVLFLDCLLVGEISSRVYFSITVSKSYEAYS